MKFKFKILSFLLIVIITLNISGCSNTKDAYIYFELPEPPLTVDPQIASSDSELILVQNIYEGLLRKNSNGDIVCGVAEKYSVNGLTYTFNLRKDAVWSNGEPVTADDFVFGFARAVSPETKSPFASKLFSIKGALEIYQGKATKKELGVKVINSHTLSITLKAKDPDFEEALTTSVAMPCNEDFFLKAAGKYGLFADNIICNGSYKLTRWRKDPFGIRLYRYQEYIGDFESENAAVFLTCDPEEPTIEKLQKNSVDMAFIDCTLSEEAKNKSLKIKEFQNICWVLTLGDEFSYNMRKSLSMLVGGEVYSNSLPIGYTVAASLFPSVICEQNILTGITAYNPTAAKNLYLEEIKNYENKKFPSDTTLYYYDNGSIKNVVTDIVGHWQSNLSAFVNIEAVSDSELLTSQLTEQNYAMSLFPISAKSTEIDEYLAKYNINYTNQDLSNIQAEILKTNNIVPVMFQNTVIAYSPALENVNTVFGNGYIDFSFIIKQES